MLLKLFRKLSAPYRLNVILVTVFLLQILLSVLPCHQSGPDSAGIRKMNDSESDTGSLDGVLQLSQESGGLAPGFQPPSPVSREQLQKRIESLQQQNRVLNMELDTYKLRVKSLQVKVMVEVKTIFYQI